MKPLVRKAPEGAFRYLWGIMDKPFKTYDELLDFFGEKKAISYLRQLKLMKKLQFLIEI